MFCVVQEEAGEAALREDMVRIIMSLRSVRLEFEMIAMMTPGKQGISFASTPQCILKRLWESC